jgi:hypothetical protein
MSAMANEPVVRHSKIVVPDRVDPHPAAMKQAQSDVAEGHTAYDLQVTTGVAVSVLSPDKEWSFSYQDVPPGCTDIKARPR